jgi:CheY-like chemotaxis protein
VVTSGLKTILLVDDESLILELFLDILQESDYRVLTANNGIEALQVLQTEVVDLLLSDIVMPGLDGFELAARVAELYPQMQIQLISGYSETGNHHLVPAELLQGIISKPVAADLLLNRLNQMLG